MLCADDKDNKYDDNGNDGRRVIQDMWRGNLHMEGGVEATLVHSTSISDCQCPQGRKAATIKFVRYLFSVSG